MADDVVGNVLRSGRRAGIGEGHIHRLSINEPSVYRGTYVLVYRGYRQHQRTSLSRSPESCRIRWRFTRRAASSHRDANTATREVHLRKRARSYRRSRRDRQIRCFYPKKEVRMQCRAPKSYLSITNLKKYFPVAKSTIFQTQAALCPSKRGNHARHIRGRDDRA